MQREAQRIQRQKELDASHAPGEFRLKLHGGDTGRRFVVIRERIRQSGASLGCQLIEAPGCTFQILVTSRQDGPEGPGGIPASAPTWRTASLN